MAVSFTFRAFAENYRKEVTGEIFFHITFSWRCLGWGLNHGLVSIQLFRSLTFFKKNQNYQSEKLPLQLHVELK